MRTAEDIAKKLVAVEYDIDLWMQDTSAQRDELGRLFAEKETLEWMLEREEKSV